MPGRRSPGSGCAARCAARSQGIAVFEGWAADLDDAAAKAAARRVRVRAQSSFRRGRPDDRHDHAEPAAARGREPDASATAPTARSTRASARSCGSAATTPRCSTGCAGSRDVLGPALGRALRAARRRRAQAADRARAHHGRRDAPAQRRLLEPAAAPARAGARPHRAERRRARRLPRLHRPQRSVLPQRRDGDGQGADRSGARHRRLDRGHRHEPQRHRLRHPRRRHRRRAGSPRRSRCRSGLYFPGFSEKDANPDMGDSAIVETVGLGGFAMAAAPAVVGYVGAGRASQAAAFTRADGRDRGRRTIRPGRSRRWISPACRPASTSGWWSRPGSRRPSTPASRIASPASARSAPASSRRRSRASSRRWSPSRRRWTSLMSVIANEVRRATYFDSIVLMRISRQVAAMAGVAEAGLMIGTPANKDILRDAGILGPDGEAAEPGDLILALRAADAAAGARRDGGGEAPARRAARGGRVRDAERGPHRPQRGARTARRQPRADLGAGALRGRRGAQGARARPPRDDLLRQRRARRRGRAQARGARARPAWSWVRTAAPRSSAARRSVSPTRCRAATSASSARPAPASRKCPA